MRANNVNKQNVNGIVYAADETEAAKNENVNEKKKNFFVYTNVYNFVYI